MQAETITKKDQIITLYSSASQCYNAGRRAYAPSNETSINTDIYMNWGVTSFKSSNPSVVKLASRKCYPLYQANPESYMSRVMIPKKAGTTVISYKARNNTYKQKVTVKKYVNPLSTLKIGSLNLTSKFNKNASYTLSYDKYKNKNLKLQVKAKNGWSISGNRYITSPKIIDRGTFVESGKTFKVTKRNASLSIYAYNDKTGQFEECLILFK